MERGKAGKRNGGCLEYTIYQYIEKGTVRCMRQGGRKRGEGGNSRNNEKEKEEPVRSVYVRVRKIKKGVKECKEMSMHNYVYTYVV